MTTRPAPGPKGVVDRHNIQSVEGGTISLPYHLADDWLFLYDATSWEGTARVRRQQRADQPVTDLREIFYGDPMLRSIIDGCRRQFARRDEIAERVHQEWIESRRRWNDRYAEEPQPEPETLTMHELARVEDPTKDLEYRVYYDTIRDIHADWLMKPCAELNDQLPRTVLLQDHNRLNDDMRDREQHWSILERCPPGISPESYAFRFGGFNTSEIVMYYEYVREIAWSCWDRLRTMSDAERGLLESSRQEFDAFVRAANLHCRAKRKLVRRLAWERLSVLTGMPDIACPLMSLKIGHATFPCPRISHSTDILLNRVNARAIVSHVCVYTQLEKTSTQQFENKLNHIY